MCYLRVYLHQFCEYFFLPIFFLFCFQCVLYTLNNISLAQRSRYSDNIDFDLQLLLLLTKIMTTTQKYHLFCCYCWLFFAIEHAQAHSKLLKCRRKETIKKKQSFFYLFEQIFDFFQSTYTDERFSFYCHCM